jgi:uncharacterized protein with ACT and thioredoxin-like domain
MATANNMNTFKFVGVSKLDGVFAVRYANDKGRAKVLERNGHTGVRFMELEMAERLEDCVDALLRSDWVCDDLDVAQAVAEEGQRLGFIL